MYLAAREGGPGREGLTPDRATPVRSESGREEIAAVVMLAPGKGVPLSEQIVSAPEAAMEIADREVARVERQDGAAGGRVAWKSALKA